MKLTVFDYGAGNLHSLTKALALSQAAVAIETDPFRCLETDVLVLPGVGAFAHAAARLAPARTAIRDAIRSGLPTIGICLGMQLLFGESEEADGGQRGLDVLDGPVTRLAATRVPQIGWNTLESARDPLLFCSRLTTAYYANSYVCRPRDAGCVMAWTTHGGDRFPAMVRAFSTVGVQFHPEKSSAAGLRFLLAALDELRS